MEKCFNIMAKAVGKDEGQQVCAGGAARTGRRLPPPVGTSDWARFSRTSYCVDKTLILKDLIDAESTVVLFTRPRRFGKTTMLEMIRAFYEPDTLVEGRGMVRHDCGKIDFVLDAWREIAREDDTWCATMA